MRYNDGGFITCLTVWLTVAQGCLRDWIAKLEWLFNRKGRCGAGIEKGRLLDLLGNSGDGGLFVFINFIVVSFNLYFM